MKNLQNLNIDQIKSIIKNSAINNSIAIKAKFVQFIQIKQMGQIEVFMYKLIYSDHSQKDVYVFMNRRGDSIRALL